MAIQAHINPENFVSLPISSPNLYSMNDNNFFNNNNNNLQHKLLLQQQFQQQQQQQQQYMLHIDNMKRRNFCNDGFVFLQPSKKQKLPVNPTTAATTTTTSTTTTTTTSGADNYIPLNVSQSLSLQLEKQSYEIDRLIVLQNERLKLALHEERKRQMRLIVKSLEAKAVRLLKQKDDEIAYATKKTMELQEIVSKMEIENQTWQNIASQNEAMVFSLSNTLEQLQQQQQQQQQQGPCCSQSSSNVVDDAESCCEILEDSKKKGVSRKVETEENRGVFGFENEKPTTTTTTTTTTREGVLLLLCKVCNSRKASVLLLPCRHMCCCKVCDESIHACPLCKSPKMASIEALF